MESDNNLAMVPRNQEEYAISSDDVMARRLKNRERQRRYRARKRLEADTKNAQSTDNPAPPRGLIQATVTHNGFENRILCRRNWKQDARRANKTKQQEVVLNFSGNESRVINFAPGTDMGPFIQSQQSSNASTNDERENRVVLGRRHWKADARNKKE